VLQRTVEPIRILLVELLEVLPVRARPEAAHALLSYLLGTVLQQRSGKCRSRCCVPTLLRCFASRTATQTLLIRPPCEQRLAIEVLHVVRIEPRVGGELVFIHPNADDPGIHQFSLEMGAPTTHENVDRSTSRQYFPLKLGQRRHGGFVDVPDKSHSAIEERIG